MLRGNPPHSMAFIPTGEVDPSDLGPLLHCRRADSKENIFKKMKQEDLVT